MSITGQKRNQWTNDEDKALINLIKKNNSEKIIWKDISKIMNSKYNFKRNSSQCRERYNNNLNPNINNEKWKIFENKKLLELFIDYGNKWAFIKTFFPLKSIKNIKNHFLGLIKICLRKLNKLTKNDIKLNSIILKVKPKTFYSFINLSKNYNEIIDKNSKIFLKIFKKYIENDIIFFNSEINFEELINSLIELNNILINKTKEKIKNKKIKKLNLKNKLSIDSIKSISLVPNNITNKDLYLKENKNIEFKNIFNDSVNVNSIDEKSTFNFLI